MAEIKEEETFKVALSKELTVHEMDEVFPRKLGLVDEDGNVKNRALTWKLKQPRRWKLEDLINLSNFFNDKGMEGPEEVLYLVAHYGLGMDGLTAEQGFSLKETLTRKKAEFEKMSGK